jgi:hypothetical protein
MRFGKLCDAVLEITRCGSENCAMPFGKSAGLRIIFPRPSDYFSAALQFFLHGLAIFPAAPRNFPSSTAPGNRGAVLP